MAVPIFTNLTTDTSSTDLTSYSTASIAPNANRMLYVFVGSQSLGGGTPSIPTVSGGGVASISGFESNTFGSRRISAYKGETGASPGSGTITIDFGSDTQTICGWTVVEVEDCVIDALPPLQEKGGNTGGNATSLSLTFDSDWGATDNRALAGWFIGTNTTIVAGTGFSIVAQSGGSGRTIGSMSGRDTDTTVDISWVTGAVGIGIAVEIEGESDTPVVGTPFFTTIGAKRI